MREKIILTIIFGAAVSALIGMGTGIALGQTTATIRSDVTTDLPDNMTREISPADLRGIFEDVLDVIDEKLSQSAVDARISSWARALGAVGTIPDAVLPNYLRQAIYSPPASWARLLGNSGTAPLAVLPAQLGRIPVSDCTTGEIWKRGSTVWGCEADGGLSLSQVDAQIAGWARAVSPTGRAPLSALPVQLARIPATDCSSGQIWKRGAAAWACEADATSTGGTGLDAAGVRGEVNTMLLTGTNIGLTRTGTGASRTVTIGVTGTFAAASIPNLPAGRINSGTFADARMPASIARDAEIETWAIQASTGQNAIVPANVIDGALTRDAEIPRALFAGSTGWDTAVAGDCLRVVAGTTTPTRTSFDWEPCPGGASVLSTTALQNDLTNRGPTTTYTVVTTPAITAAQAGSLLLVGNVDITVGNTGGDAGGVVVLTLRRGATVLLQTTGYGSNTGFADADRQIILPVTAAVGDTFDLRVSANIGNRNYTIEDTTSFLTLYRP